ncbi:MAG TPA: GFA family protein [Rubrobacter sp.]
MLLEGSCHCGAINFRVESETPYPYQACYCSICRKTAGGGGYAINLGADANTLEIEGKENLSVYHAKLYDRGGPGEVQISEVERNFCKLCGSCLWVYDPRWPDLVHPFASAVDTPLPKPPERVHAALEFAAPWCMIPEGENERHFALWPEESIAQWHRRHGLEHP